MPFSDISQGGNVYQLTVRPLSSDYFAQLSPHGEPRVFILIILEDLLLGIEGIDVGIIGSP